MGTLTIGKNFLRAQVENSRAVSANQCSQTLRKLVYGILNDAADDDGEGKMTMVQEWDRCIFLDSEGLTVRPSNVPIPRQMGSSIIPRLDKDKRLLVLLDALHSNTAHIRSLPEKFKLIAASLRFLVDSAQPMLEMNHLVALLCCCVTLKKHPAIGNSTKRRFPSLFFELEAAQSFSQWQCVLRDTIDLNFILLELVPTPCIHKIFNGLLVHFLREKLDQGRSHSRLQSSCLLRMTDGDKNDWSPFSQPRPQSRRNPCPAEQENDEPLDTVFQRGMS